MPRLGASLRGVFAPSFGEAKIRSGQSLSTGATRLSPDSGSAQFLYLLYAYGIYIILRQFVRGETRVLAQSLGLF